VTSFRPFALDIIAPPDQAFDIADKLGMEGEMDALGVTVFNAPNDMMLVQGLYGSSLNNSLRQIGSAKPNQGFTRWRLDDFLFMAVMT